MIDYTYILKESTSHIEEGDTVYICKAGNILKDKPLKVLKIYWGKNQEMMMAKTQLPSGAIRHYPMCWLWKTSKTIKESTAKSYKFEIWWNTGDWHWDREPDIEFFTGTIKQLNDYINSKVEDMGLEHIGWDEERADIDEEDINELMSTGTLQKCEGNVVWMLRSVKE